MAALPKPTNDAVGIPDDTHYKILDLQDAVSEVKKAPTPGHATARVRRVYRLGVELKERSDQLVQNMERGERWLQSHEGHAKFREREDQWIRWLKEYEAIEDALEAASEVDR